jgi:ribosomal protein L20
MLVFLIIAYVFSSTKFEKRHNSFYLEARGVRGSRRGQVAQGSNDLNNVCTYEYMNKEKKLINKITLKIECYRITSMFLSEVKCFKYTMVRDSCIPFVS